MTGLSRIVLVGPMGSGKSTVMEILSDRLGWIGLDTDQIVAEREDRSVAEVFAADGEEMFRSLELSALEAALSWTSPVVISTGGGIVETQAARRLLAAEPGVVQLRVSPSVALGRIGDPSGRPLLSEDPLGALVRLGKRRRPFFDEVTSAVIEVDDRTADEVADEILTLLSVAA